MTTNCEWCKKPLSPPKRAQGRKARFCSRSHKSMAWVVRTGYGRPETYKEILVPIPDVPAGHPLYDEARISLTSSERHELGTDMDSGARDALQIFVLALLEGNDPTEAVKTARRRIYKDRKTLVHGLTLTDGLER